MTEIQQYVSDYFGITEPQNLAAMEKLFRRQTLQKGDFFLHVGKPCHQLSFIHSGLLRIYVQTPEKEVTQWISTPGYFVTELSSYLFDTPARWNIQALTDVELYTLDRKDYVQLTEIIPNWHELEKRFIAKCFTILEDRIFSHLSMSAEERYTFFFERNKELFQHVPLQYIASMLGMTPETFSRVRKKLLH